MLKVTGAGPRARLAIVAGLFLVALVTGAWLLDRGSRSGATSISPFQAARLFDQVMQHASGDFVDSIPDSVLYRKAVTGMLYELHDPQSAYIPGDRFARVRGLSRVDSAPLGIAVEVREKSIVVIAAAPGSPSARAGIQPGDELARINGQATDGWTVEEARDALRGPPGSSVSLLIARPGGPDSIAIALTRDTRRQSTVRDAAVIGDVGYLQLASLDDSTAAELEGAVTSLLVKGARSLILDLRDNAAGAATYAVKVSDLFLGPKQRVVTINARDRKLSRVFDDSSAEKWPALVLAILVNGRTAGGAEIITGALQDHDRTLVVGHQTYGKGSEQSDLTLGAFGGLELTTARWYTPSGRAVGKPQSDEDEDDPQNVLLRLKKFRTDAGRGVFGTGGLVPDVLIGDTTTTYQEAALADQLGGKVAILNDELAKYAAEMKSRNAIKSPDFAVTPAMRDDLWRRITARGVKIDRFAFDQAEPYLSRLIGDQIARTVFGPDAALRRRSLSDRALGKAIQLARGVRNERALLRRGALDSQSADSVRAR